MILVMQMVHTKIFIVTILSPSYMYVALSPGPTQKIGERVWSPLQKFPYVLCQQSSGVEESHSSIANY